MSNFFGTNALVPNGYIYTTQKGSEYIVLEGVWFNHSNLKMVDPSKTQKMNEAALNQIMKYNSTSKIMIGEKFNLIGNDYTYLGEGRFSENGIVMTESSVLTELLADDERVYEVSQDTLNNEWNELKFSILPPHAEDITIPPGFVVNGFKFIPRGQGFVNVRTGEVADPATARKLFASGRSQARSQATKNKFVPLNSTLMTGNSRSRWNGTDFCDNDGTVVVPAAQAQRILSMYQKFVEKNANQFPTLMGAGAKEQRFGADLEPQRTPVTEAITSSDLSNFKRASTDQIEIPRGYKIGDYYFRKDKGDWGNGGQAVTDKSLNRDLNSQAIQQIKEYNASEEAQSEYPINSTIDYKGDTLTWNGTEWVDGKGKGYKSSAFMDSVDEFIKANPESANDDSSSNETELKGAESGLVKGKTHITDKNGKVFIYQGGNSFVNPQDDSTIPDEQAKSIIKRYEDTQKGEVQSTDLGDEAPESHTNKNGTLQEPQDTSTTQTNVPDGFAITSKAGVKYIKKAGQWISSQTKKAMNSSAAKSIERAAENKIIAHNEKSPVKIGDKWTSNKGKEYTYVGDDRLISSDGKLVPKESARKIMQKLSNDAEELKSPEQEDTVQKDAETVQQTTSTEPEVQKSPNSTEEPVQSGENGLQSLADEIKKHPKSRKIQVLLTRGDKVSILAADLLLNGAEKDAIDILKALNSTDDE